MDEKFFTSSFMITPLSDNYQIEETKKYYHSKEDNPNPCTFVSNEFKVNEIIGDEILRISAYGLYKCFINDEEITKDILTPGWVNYSDRLPFQTYNVSSILNKGTNTIKIWLADGWFRGPLFSTQSGIKVSNIWGSKIGTIAELRNKNGILISTDENWKSGLLPILKSGIYYGEKYDANIIPKISNTVDILDFDKSLLVEHEIDAVQELPAIEVSKNLFDKENNTIYDFGQNVAGYVSIIVSGEKGATILIEHSEVLTPIQDNLSEQKKYHFDNANFRNADAIIEYTLSGNGDEYYKPHFTFMGFRYARVKKLNGNVKVKQILSIPISSLSKQKLEFETSNQYINRLIQNISWSQKANFIEVPTDCPQRDERLGWTGDAQLFASTACYFYNCENFFIKFLNDLRSEQDEEGAIGHFSPDVTRNGKTNDPRLITENEKKNGSWCNKGATGWGDAIVIIPWVLYKHYGNLEILKICQSAMIKWCEYLYSISNDSIIRNPKYSTIPEGIKLRGFTFGDWVAPTGKDFPPFSDHISDDCYSTIYYFISTSIVAKISKILGDSENYNLYKKKSNKIKDSFADEFINSSSGQIGNNDQTSYAMCFANDMIPDEKKDKAKNCFKQAIIDRQYRVGTGIHGSAYLLKGLKKAGLDELIEKVLLQENLPGWIFPIKQGATTIWERWNAIAENGVIHDPSMNSFNHYAFGSIGEFIIENIVGIRPDENNPGFKNILIEPLIMPSLYPIKFKHQCKNGLIEIDIKVEKEEVIYKINIPQNSTGEIITNSYKKIILNELSYSKKNVNLKEGINIIKFFLK